MAANTMSSPSHTCVKPCNGERRQPEAKHPQEIIDEFWTSFISPKPGKISTIVPENARLVKAASKAGRRGLIRERPANLSFTEAAERCRAKVLQIAKECRALNRKYRDVHFDLENSRTDTLCSLTNGPPRTTDIYEPKSVKRVKEIFDNPTFFINDKATDDVVQGQIGDCWFIAALCMLSRKSGLIERLCVERDTDVGVYGFVFYRDGEWISEIVDDNLFLTRPNYDANAKERTVWENWERADSEEAYRQIYQTNSQALYFSHCRDPNATWLPLLEKAYAKAHGDYYAIGWGLTGEGVEDLTGGVFTSLATSDILNKDEFWENDLKHVNQEFLFSCSTDVDADGIRPNHAYSVADVAEAKGTRLVKIKNPHGREEWTGPWADGSSEWTAELLQLLGHKFGDDGVFWIEYEDFLRKFQRLMRIRLFDEDWRIAAIWTPVQVPWQHEYLDTYFKFTLNTSGEIVIVLSQLDSRYYWGLEGQYQFELGFQLHRLGRGDWEENGIVTRLCDYPRSVNVEINLDAGDYAVMVKIEATRSSDRLPPEEVVRQNVEKRKDKLLKIGHSYDYANAKAGQQQRAMDFETPSSRRVRGGAQDEDSQSSENAKGPASSSCACKCHAKAIEPWNAAAVIGLRIYHQIGADKDKEVVTLEVVRPDREDTAVDVTMDVDDSAYDATHPHKKKVSASSEDDQ